MKIQAFLKLVGQPGRTNYFAVCPDDLGLSLLLAGALSPIATPEDVNFVAAENVTKEKARQLEREARFAPRGSSELTHFFVYGLQNLPTESAGPLLKVVEEATYARFIFQAQSTPRKIHTLMSRSTVVQIPWLPRKMVLANLKAMNYDAKTADNLNLYDGTLGGTVKALAMKDTLTNIRRDMKRGMRGIASLMTKEVLDSNAFDMATRDVFTRNEQAFLNRYSTLDRKRLVMYLAMSREEGQ